MKATSAPVIRRSMIAERTPLAIHDGDKIKRHASIKLPFRRSILLFLLTALLCSCVQNKPYRLGGIHDERLEKAYPAQKPASEMVPVSDERNYRISFVEFDERGDFWDRRQLAKAARYIGHSRKPVLLVTYIHGWHHNAKDRPRGGKNPGDVQMFRCLLSELAVSESTRNFAVHGVYLGWRGRLIEGPLDYLTFLDRKAAATRVAGTPVTETIFELIRQARKDADSKCVVIGHSFGGLLLEKAMAQAITGSVISKPQGAGEEHFTAPADLVLLVNSAAESLYAKEMTDMFTRIGYRDDDMKHRNLPLLVSITSENDTATSGWFPIGTFLPNLFAHRKYHWGPRHDSASDETDQNIYLTKTPGHNRMLFTHWVDDKTGPPPTAMSEAAVERMAIDIQQRDCAVTEEHNPAFEQNLRRSGDDLLFATSLKGDPNQFKWWRIRPHRADRRTPYWIMQVPKAIIPQHTPIFTPEGRAMMAALFRIANPKDMPGSKQYRLVPPSAE
jgi:hypothetical protein